MAPTKRTSTKRKSARRPSTRRTSSRRSSSSRRPSSRKTTTRRKTPKGLRLTRKTQKQILIAVAVVVAVLVLLAFMQKTRPIVGKKSAGGEIARNAVYGKVTSINVGPARKAIRVRSLNTGKVYTFYVGWRTKFSPNRWPSRGERVKIYYVNDEGYLKATRVYIR